MTVYIDVLFVVNMFVNYFLLLISGAISKVVCSRVRIIIASALGGVYCVLIYTTDIGVFQNVIFRIASAFVMAIIAFKYIRFSHFMRCSLVLVAAGLFFGGAIYGITFLLSPNIINFKNSVVYIHISPVILILSSVVIYLVIILFNYLLKPQSLSENTSYTVTIKYHQNVVQAPGFIDTGNQLTDIFTDYPVILCNFSIVENLFTEEEKTLFKDPFSIDSSKQSTNFRMIPTSTVNGFSLLPTFKPDSILLKNSKGELLVDRVLVAVFKSNNNASQHKIILNPELITIKEQGGKTNVF